MDRPKVTDGEALALREVEKVDKLAALRKIVKEHTTAEVDGVLMDAFTASMLVKVHGALNQGNQGKFLAMSIAEMIDVGWKLVN